MGRSRYPLFFILLMGASALFMAGCAGFISGMAGEKDPRALRLSRQLQAMNHGLQTVKGTAHVILTHGSTRQRFKIAWAAILPDKIRLTIVEAGMPLETLLADGDKVYFISHTGRHQRHTIKSSNPSLKSMVGVPVRIREIIALLAGKLPLEPFDQERISFTGKTGITTLFLSRKWRGGMARVQFDPNDQIIQFETVAGDGNLVYQVIQRDLKSFGPYLVPETTHVTDSSGRTMTLRINNFYPDLSIKASVFTLTETE